MVLKKQVQLIHTLKNEQFRNKYLNTRNGCANSSTNEYDILFNEVTIQPNSLISRPQMPTLHHLPNRHQVRVTSCRLSEKEFEDCFIVDIT